MQCNVMQFNSMSWYAMTCNAMTFNAMSCNDMPCNDMPCNDLQWNDMQCNDIQKHAMQWNDMSLHVIALHMRLHWRNAAAFKFGLLLCVGLSTFPQWQWLSKPLFSLETRLEQGDTRSPGQNSRERLQEFVTLGDINKENNKSQCNKIFFKILLWNMTVIHFNTYILNIL